jgi:hypothetical protein
LQKIIDTGNIDGFRVFVNENCYRKEWQKTDWKAVSDLDAQDKILLFQLYSQDFAMDGDFAMDDRDRNRTKKAGKDEIRENLHTRYWRDCLEKNLKHVHIAPESRIFLRPKKDQNDLGGDIGKLRFREEKITADFQLVLYPEKKITTVEANDAIVKKLTEAGVKAFIGIDRGEKSLANYMIVGLDGKTLLDESGKALKGDMTFQNTLGEFVELRDIEKIGKESKKSEYKPNLKNTLDSLNLPKITGEDKKPHTDWNHPEITLEILRDCRAKMEDELDSENPKNLKLVDLRYPNGNPDDIDPETGKIRIDPKTGKPRPVRVYDHRHSMNHARLLQRIIYEMWKKDEMQDFILANGSTEESERSRFVSQLLSSREIRGGYVGTFVHQIAELAEKYQAVVVFEDLNVSYDSDSGEEENFLSGIVEA